MYVNTSEGACLCFKMTPPPTNRMQDKMRKDALFVTAEKLPSLGIETPADSRRQLNAVLSHTFDHV